MNIKLNKDAKKLLILRAMKTNFGNAQLQDKSRITFDGTTLKDAINQPIFLTDGASDWFVLSDGIYETVTQMQFTILNGVLKSINAQGSIPATSNDPIKQSFDKVHATAFGKNIKPAKSNIVDGQLERMRADLKAKETGKYFGEGIKPATTNVAETQLSKFRKYVLGIKEVSNPIAKVELSEAVKADLALFNNLSPEETKIETDKAIAREKAEKERIRLAKKNEIPSARSGFQANEAPVKAEKLTPLQEALLEKGWVNPND